MTTSTYASTTKTTNYNRACRAILGPCSDQFRELLRRHVPISKFNNVVNQYMMPRLTKPQFEIVFPKNTSYVGNYEDFDISLLYTFLRNICNIQPHKRGWGADPDPGDRSLSANIERILLIRNYLGHITSPELSKLDFDIVWSMISLTVEDLDSIIHTKFVDDVTFLLHEVMDPDLQSTYSEFLRKQMDDFEHTKEMVRQTWQNVSKVQNEVLDPIPKNIKELNDIEIEKWKDEDKLFLEIRGFTSMMKRVHQQPCVTVVGVPGSGKSATVRHIALLLQERYGYEIVPIKEIMYRETFCKPHTRQVFIIDDIVGVFGPERSEVFSLDKYSSCISTPSMRDSKTLMTCRQSVFNEVISSSKLLSNKTYTIRLHDAENILDDNDKFGIFKKHNLDPTELSSCDMAEICKMFPFLCKLYSSDDSIREIGNYFFIKPVPCILDQLDDMRVRKNIQYAGLVLCMFSNNMLSEDILKNMNDVCSTEMRNFVLRSCKLRSSTEDLELIEAMESMIGTYTHNHESLFSFLHDALFDICALHYGKQHPEEMIKYMSPSYVSKYIKLEKGTSDKTRSSTDLYMCILTLKEKHFEALAERLLRDIQNSEIYYVFSNTVIDRPDMCQRVIDRMIQEDISVDISDSRNLTPLIVSCLMGYENTVTRLVKAGANINQNALSLYTPLTAACQEGHLHLVRKLLAMGAEVNLFAIQGQTPLTASCSKGHIDVVRELLNNNANIDISDGLGDKPLQVAHRENHANIVEELEKRQDDTKPLDVPSSTKKPKYH